MEKLGFEVLTKKNAGFFVGKKVFRRLREEKGLHYAEAYANKLLTTHYMLARKKDNPSNVDAKDFWFESIAPEIRQEKKKIKEKSKTPPKYKKRKI